MIKSLPLLGLLKTPKNIIIFLGVFAVIFYLNYYLMSHLAGEKDRMCVLGGNLTSINLIFVLLMAALAGLIVIGFLENLKKRQLGLLTLESGSTSFLGLILGTFTAFCTLCSLPVITIFGFSVGIGFITDYEIYFKLASLLLMFLGLYLVNKELLAGCVRCKD